jgi:uncharacterized membrane protein HdeD (DUF308 family)
MPQERRQEYHPQVVCSLEPNWWIFGIRGALSILFGIVAMFMPLMTVLGITIAFGVYITIDGLFLLISGINRAQRGQQWGGLVLSGITSIMIGLAILVLPQVASFSFATFLWTVICLWATSTGIFELAAAIRLRREIHGEWYLALDGLLSVMFGTGIFILLWSNPLFGQVLLGYLIALYAIMSGALLVFFASRLFKIIRGRFPSDTMDMIDMI